MEDYLRVLINIGEVYLRYWKRKVGMEVVVMSELTIKEHRRKALEIFMNCKRIY